MANFTTTGSDVYPTGHIVKSALLWQTVNASAIDGTGTGYQSTGVSGTITTLRASSDTRLKFMFFRGMMHVPTGYTAQHTMTFRSGSHTTTYASGDDMVQSNSYSHYVNGGLHQPKYEEHHFTQAQLTTGNLGSYTAGQTLYWRFFFKISSGGSYTFLHSGSHAWVSYEEIEV